MSAFRPWTADESSALDAEIKASRPKPKPNPQRTPSRRQPKQKPSGRWSMTVHVDGRQIKRTFDTPAEAVAWRDQMTNRQEQR